MKKQKILMIVWGILVVIVVVLLTVLGFMISKKYKPYHDLENRLKEAGTKYGNDKFIYQDGVSEYTITYDDLKEKYIDKLEVNGDTCTGYVKMTFKQVASYKAYIKCNHYTTKGYK